MRSNLLETASALVVAIASSPAIAQAQVSPDLAAAVPSATPTANEVAALTANNGPGREESPGGGQSLGDIVVTAEKRSVNALKTPIAVTVLNAQDLAEKGVTQNTDLQNVVPGVAIQQNGSVTVINIRGIGLSVVSPNTSSGVVNYRDGVLITHEPYLLDSFYDIAQIEVLRGPQGTLAGSNSTGGAVFVSSTTATPDRVKGFLEQTLGDYGETRTQGAVNVPLSDRLAVRFAGVFENRDSYWTRVDANGQPIRSQTDSPGDLRQRGGRISVLAKPTDNLTITLKSEYDNTRTHGVASIPTPFSAFYGFAPTQPYRLAYGTDTGLNQKTSRSILQVDWKIAPNITLRSQSAYSWLNNRETEVQDASLFNGSVISFDNTDRVFQQEIDLLSSNTGRLQWSVGIFLYRDKQKQKDFNIFLRGTPAMPLPFPFPLDIQITGTPKADSTAGFGQLTYQLTETIQLEGGLRVTHDKRDSLTGATAIPAFGVNIPNDGRYSGTNVTGKAGINFTPDAHNLFYAFAARGAKAGGYNTPGPNFGSEKLWNYEVGWKASLFAGRVRTQIDGFYNDYKDIQLNLYNPVTTQTAVGNADRARSGGVEASVQARAAGFAFDGNVAYIRSRFGSYSLFDSRYPAGTIVNLRGNPLPFSPHWTANGELSYPIALAGGRSITPRVQVSYISSQQATVFDVPGRDFIEGHTLLDLRLTFKASEMFRLEGFVQNLLDEHYIQTRASSNVYDTALYGAPRTFGVRGTITF